MNCTGHTLLIIASIISFIVLLLPYYSVTSFMFLGPMAFTYVDKAQTMQLIM